MAKTKTKNQPEGQAKVLADLQQIVKTSKDDWEIDQAQRRITRIEGQMARGSVK